MRRGLTIGLWLVALMLLTAQIGAAQVVNPNTVEFTISSDHNATQFGTAVVTRYELRIYASGAAQPITVSDLGKPTAADGATVSFQRAAVFAAVPAVGTYDARVVAIGPSGEGVSTPVPFVAQVRVPGPPIAPGLFAR